MDSASTLQSVPDEDLLRRLDELVSHSRRVEVDLVSHIGEVEVRRLYAHEAFPSMFSYCTAVLHLSEAEAYLRITVARAAREHPLLLTMLGDGRLHLSGIVKLLPILTRENRHELLKRATHQSKRQIVALVAELSPQPDAPSVIRKLPQRRPAPPLAALDQSLAAARLFELGPDRVEASPAAPIQAPTQVGTRSPELGPDGVETAAPATASPFVPPPASSRPTVVEPLSLDRYKVQFTASTQLRDKLERLSALMRSEVPDGDLAAIIEAAVSEKLERIEARRYATTNAPRKQLSDTDTAPTSRNIPAAVRRAVRERDGNRCRYVDERARRCSERDRLEFHHRHPFGMGGDHSPDNLRLLCPSHNRYLAEVDFGQAAISRRSPRRTPPPRPPTGPMG